MPKWHHQSSRIHVTSSDSGRYSLLQDISRWQTRTGSSNNLASFSDSKSKNQLDTNASMDYIFSTMAAEPKVLITLLLLLTEVEISIRENSDGLPSVNGRRQQPGVSSASFGLWVVVVVARHTLRALQLELVVLPCHCCLQLMFDAHTIDPWRRRQTSQ